MLGSLVGQRCVLDRLVGRPGYARLKYKGLWRKDMPLVLLLTGPSGTGKTLLARNLAEALLGQPVQKLESSGRFRTFHMNVFSLVEDQKSFFGPPKGIAGVGDLPEVLKEWPDAVILLDEIEKAHPSFARALLKVFGENGAVYDSRTGRDVPTTRATFILTSNLAKDLIGRHVVAASKREEDDPECLEYGKLREDVMDALRQPHIEGRSNFFIESEIRGRLTDVLPFLPFSVEEVRTAVRGFLSAEARAFSAAPEFSNIALAWEPSVVMSLASEYLRRPEEGLRGVRNHLEGSVRGIVANAIDVGILQRFSGALLQVSSAGSGGVPGQLEVRAIAPSSIASKWPGVVSNAAVLGIGGYPSGLSDAWFVGGSSSGASHAHGGVFASAGGLVWGSDTEWERMHEWDWEMAWQHLFEFIWEWRFPLALFSVMAVSATVATLGPAIFGPVAGVASAAAAPATAGGMAPATAAVMGSSAVTWATSIPAMVQLVTGAGSVAVPVLSAAWALQHRDMFAAVIWALVALMTLPVATRCMFGCCCARRREVYERRAPDCSHHDHACGETRKRGRANVGGPVPRRRRLATAAQHSQEFLFSAAAPVEQVRSTPEPKRRQTFENNLQQPAPFKEARGGTVAAAAIASHCCESGSGGKDDEENDQDESDEQVEQFCIASESEDEHRVREAQQDGRPRSR